MDLGKKLIILRENKDLTRKKVAQDLNITYTTFSKYENNERQPDYDTLKTICNYFNVSTDFMLNHQLNNPSIDNTVFNILQSLSKIEQSMVIEYAQIAQDLTLDEQNQLIQFAKFLKYQRKNV